MHTQQLLTSLVGISDGWQRLETRCDLGGSGGSALFSVAGRGLGSASGWMTKASITKWRCRRWEGRLMRQWVWIAFALVRPSFCQRIKFLRTELDEAKASCERELLAGLQWGVLMMVHLRRPRSFMNVTFVFCHFLQTEGNNIPCCMFCSLLVGIWRLWWWRQGWCEFETEIGHKPTVKLFSEFNLAQGSTKGPKCLKNIVWRLSEDEFWMRYQSYLHIISSTFFFQSLIFEVFVQHFVT